MPTAAATSKRGHRGGGDKECGRPKPESIKKEFSELQGGTTQAEEEVRFRGKGRAGVKKVCGLGNTQVPFGSGGEKGARLSPGEQRREERGIDGAGWSWRSERRKRTEACSHEKSSLFECARVRLCVGVRQLTAVLLLGDGADDVAGVHEAQEL